MGVGGVRERRDVLDVMHGCSRMRNSCETLAMCVYFLGFSHKTLYRGCLTPFAGAGEIRDKKHHTPKALIGKNIPKPGYEQGALKNEQKRHACSDNVAIFPRLLAGGDLHYDK